MKKIKGLLFKLGLRCSVRRGLLTGVLLLNVLLASAQWRVGVTAGYTSNKVDINSNYAYDVRYKSMDGFSIGIPVVYDFINWFALRGELQFIQKGYKMYRAHYFDGIYTNTRNNYLQLPLMANFSFGGDRIRGFVNAGGYIGYWLNSYIKGTIPTYFGQNDGQSTTTLLTPGIRFDFDQKAEFMSKRDNRFEAGALVGLGLSYRITSIIELQGEARYYYSLTDMQKKYMKFQTPRYNSTISIQVGCVVTLKTKKQTWK